MTFSLWLSLATICTLGAISPGPSLAVVLRHSTRNGRSHGIFCALAHAAGVALWAALTVFGLAMIVEQTPWLYSLITYAGAAYLAWMGINALAASNRSLAFSVIKPNTQLLIAGRDGLMISLLNPKLAIFFMALFSQFVSAQQLLPDQLLMISTATLIDALWYSILAILLSQSSSLGWLHKRALSIERISGICLIGLAISIVVR